MIDRRRRDGQVGRGHVRRGEGGRSARRPHARSRGSSASTTRKRHGETPTHALDLPRGARRPHSRAGRASSDRGVALPLRLMSSTPGSTRASTTTRMSMNAGGGPCRTHDAGDKDYAGATPSWVVWQLFTLATRARATPCSTPCAAPAPRSDVRRPETQGGIGFDLNLSVRHSARGRPRPAAGRRPVDFAFVDPPYSTHHINARTIPTASDGSTPSPDARMKALSHSRGDDGVIAEIDRVPATPVHGSVRVGLRKRGEPGQGGGVFMAIGFASSC